MPISKAQQKAVAKYESKSYDKVLLRLQKGKREIVQAAAEGAGQSLNGFVVQAIDERVEREKGAN
jgi:uncharacterized protein (DUF1778 family)